MPVFVYLIIGIIAGMVTVIVAARLAKKDSQKLAQELVVQAQAEKLKDLESFLGRMKESFNSISLEALNKNAANFMELAKATLSQQTAIGTKELESKKDLISQNLQQIKDDMKANMEKVANKISEFEKERQNKYGELSNQLLRLGDTTGKLTEALAGSGTRGQWGQRIADDVLRLAGFIEGINYFKQKTMDSSSQRPDFTFVLPNQQKINMDVKFPFANYQGYLQAKSEDEKNRHKEAFLRDVRKHLKNLTSHDYISHEENTLDMVIMFIPNEQVYSFINQNDTALLDEAIASKVVVCSPLTLFAILAIIRQAIDNFNLEKTTNEIISLLGNFYKQWGNFIESFEKLGKKVDEAHSEYEKLMTVRRSKLQKPLDRIEQLRLQRGLPIAESDSGDSGQRSLPEPNGDESGV